MLLIHRNPLIFRLGTSIHRRLYSLTLWLSPKANRQPRASRDVCSPQPYYFYGKKKEAYNVPVPLWISVLPLSLHFSPFYSSSPMVEVEVKFNVIGTTVFKLGLNLDLSVFKKLVCYLECLRCLTSKREKQGKWNVRRNLEFSDVQHSVRVCGDQAPLLAFSLGHHSSGRSDEDISFVKPGMDPTDQQPKVSTSVPQITPSFLYIKISTKWKSFLKQAIFNTHQRSTFLFYSKSEKNNHIYFFSLPVLDKLILRNLSMKKNKC